MRSIFAIALSLSILASPARAYFTCWQESSSIVNLSDLLFGIQLYNMQAYHCDEDSEYGWSGGPGAHDCDPLVLDYNPQDWVISLPELLRLIQFYNGGGAIRCPGQGTEDGYCPVNSGITGPFPCELVVPTDEISIPWFGTSGGSLTGSASGTCTALQQATSSAEWLQIEVSANDCTERFGIYYWADENTSPEPRTATITWDGYAINVQQDGNS